MNREIFRALRLKEGLTQKEFASILGVSTSSVEAIETGRRNISDKVRAKLAQEYPLDESYFTYFDQYEKLQSNPF
ncbi:transcriptional regulator with XRE-family HTH domain [Alkalihalobacillus xiaoxiensis]|uniref:Transcriptional regulator with XRE-family HTH domain n=1 Tax=Shouchella xiaoxiensis TaxID=766895 RepID=A0ABS2SVS2_9BACI|nr:helix-turn-helix transcriptional regulator [Shouchella xiaoxiensis]MBM7838347.1 transcriptional regulator with XRE-family HTH domain [Shouchella xiaoxiensis]